MDRETYRAPTRWQFEGTRDASGYYISFPVLLGCLLFVALLTYFPEQRFVGSIGCILLIFGLRAAAIHWKLTVPYWFTTKPAAE
jgi:cadmium resistance protein CadD (predicted permease)